MYEKSRNPRKGKYLNYEKIILEFLIKQEDDVTAITIRIHTEIPKSSFYEVLGRLRYWGYVDWIGEPQDWTSFVGITQKGRNYLKKFIKA